MSITLAGKWVSSWTLLIWRLFGDLGYNYDNLFGLLKSSHVASMA
jgi:hypothetical protein